MTDTQEHDLLKLEASFPHASWVAFAEARAKAFAAGQSVLEAYGDTIYEMFPDGRRVAVKKVSPPTCVVIGTKIKIR